MKTIGWILGLTFLLLIVAAIIIPTTAGGPPKHRGVTRANMSEIQMACLLYFREYGAIPDFSTPAELSAILARGNERKLSFISLGEPLANHDGLFIDGWGRPLIVRRLTDDIQIRSLGKDGIPSDDDLEITIYDSEKKNEPNNAVEPTPVDVTIPAAQEVAPSTSAAHLGR